MIPSANSPMVCSMDQPQNTSFPAPVSTSPFGRGKHETYPDYYSRAEDRWHILGRHEVRPPGEGFLYKRTNKLVAAYAPTDPKNIDQMMTDVKTALGLTPEDLPHVSPEGELSYSKSPSQARITGYKHMTTHPSWSINPCPYPTGHKPGCSWQDGPAWIETGIRPS